MAAKEVIARADQLTAVAADVKKVLSMTSRFVLWLEGPMGAGKTTFARHLLRAFGLPEKVPVVSPTYTIMNEYEIKGDWYAHLDFYRADQRFSLDELGLDAKDYRGILIEWPEAPAGDATVEATHRLIIKPVAVDARSYLLTVVIN